MPASEKPPSEAMREALAEIRREGYKAAVIVAVVDAVACLIAVTLVATLLGVDRTLSLTPVTNGLVQAAVPLRVLIAVGVGVLVGGTRLGWQLRAPLVEQFEAGNPEVEEALRTARDAVHDGAADPVARALYSDVIDRLRQTSSLAFIDVRRIGATVTVVLLLSFALLHTSAAGITLLGAPNGGPNQGAGGPHDTGTGNGTTTAVTLQSGEQVMGASTNVSAGKQNLSARVSAGGAGEGTGSLPGDTAQQGLPSTQGDIDATRAGYTSRDRIEDAELIREYATKLQETDDD